MLVVYNFDHLDATGLFEDTGEGGAVDGEREVTDEELQVHGEADVRKFGGGRMGESLIELGHVAEEEARAAEGFERERGEVGELRGEWFWGF